MHVMLLIVMYNTVCSPFSNFFFFIKQSEEDVSQFDSKFTRQTPVDSPDDSALSESANQVFLGFTYVAPSVLESVKEKFSFEPKIRSPRRFIGSPRTPVRYSDFVIIF